MNTYKFYYFIKVRFSDRFLGTFNIISLFSIFMINKYPESLVLPQMFLRNFSFSRTD